MISPGKGFQYVLRLAADGGEKVSSVLEIIGDKGEKSFKKISGAADLTNMTMEKLQTGVKRATIALAAQAAALAYLTQRQMGVIDANAKMADSFSLSYKEMTDMALVAEENGVGFENLGAAMTSMQNKLAEAANGSKGAREEFERLGLPIEDLLRMSPAEQFAAVAEAISDMENSTLKMGVASKLFGEDAGRRMLGIFDDYQEKIRDAAEFNDKFGISLSRIDAAKVEQANDAFGRVKGAISGIVNTIAVQVSPAIEGISKDLTDLGYNKENFAEGVADVMDVMAQMAELVRRSFYGVGLAVGSVKVVAADVTLYVMERMQELGHSISETLNKVPGVKLEASISDFDIMKARAKAESARMEMHRTLKKHDEAFADGNTIPDLLKKWREESEKRAAESAKRLQESQGNAANSVLDPLEDAEEATKRLKEETKRAEEAAKDAQDAYGGFVDGLIDGLDDGKLSLQELGQVALDTFKNILNARNASGGTVGGDIMSGIAGFIGSGISNFIPKFDVGGTVHGDQMAFLHDREEVLAPAEAREYRAGRTGGDVSVTVIDNVGAKVSARQQRGSNGQRELILQLDDMGAALLRDPNSKMSQAATAVGGMGMR